MKPMVPSAFVAFCAIGASLFATNDDASLIDSGTQPTASAVSAVKGYELVRLTEDNYAAEVEQSKLPVVIDAYATWCYPCRLLAPRVKAVGKRLEGKVKFTKFDVDEQQALSAKFQISAMPTLLFVKDGKVIDRVVGLISEQELDRRVRELL